MLTFLGDVALISDDVNSEYKPCGDYIFNCEYVICDNKQNKPVAGKINLSSLKCNFDEIFGKNPVAVTLSNNHTFDYGENGFSETKKYLGFKGIDCIENQPWKYGNIYVLNFMDLKSSNLLDESLKFNKTQVAYEINNLKKDSRAKIIVIVHWGVENAPNETQEQKTLAHWLIDSGVDLIIGHHPHCIQPVEKYKDKYIFYSLGNGLFPSINQPSHYDSEGNPTRIYRFKWQKWNRMSYAVNLNEDTLEMKIDELIQKNNTLYLNKQYSIDDLINKRCLQNRVVYVSRKYWLFFISNFMVDGKLFDFNAIKQEFAKNG